MKTTKTMVALAMLVCAALTGCGGKDDATSQHPTDQLRAAGVEVTQTTVWADDAISGDVIDGFWEGVHEADPLAAKALERNREVIDKVLRRKISSLPIEDKELLAKPLADITPDERVRAQQIGEDLTSVVLAAHFNEAAR